MATRVTRALGGLLVGPAVLAGAGMVVNGLNLIMNLVLARVLGPTEYGAVVVLVGIFMILSVLGSALLIAVVQRETASGHTRREQWAWIRRLRGFCASGVMVSAVVAVVLCQPIAAVLSFSHPLAVAEAMVAAALWTLLCIERGVLQARGAYTRLARNFVVEAAARIGLIVVFVVLGLGVTGAGLGLMLGIALGVEHARWGVARAPRLPADPPRVPSPTATGPIPLPRYRRDRDGLVANTGVALGALVPLALLQNIDVVIVGWLNSDGVGMYAAIATACKVPVFIGLAVANFLLPEAARRRAAGRGASRVLLIALGFVVAPGLALAGAGAAAAEPLLSIFFGADLTGGASALWILALAMTYLAVSLMLTTYLLGSGERRVVVVLAVCTMITVVGLFLADGGVRRTASAALACQALTAGAVGVLVFRLHLADRRRASTAERPASPVAPVSPPASPPVTSPVGRWVPARSIPSE